MSKRIKEASKPETPKPFTKLGNSLNHTYEVLDKLLTFWIPVMGLDRWSFKVNYKTQPEDAQGIDAYARIRPSWEYRNATIDIFMMNLVDVSDEMLEYTILHELCHAMVAPIAGKETRIEDEEAVVTDLGKAFFYARYPEKLEHRSKVV